MRNASNQDFEGKPIEVNLLIILPVLQLTPSELIQHLNRKWLVLLKGWEIFVQALPTPLGSCKNEHV